MVSSTNFVDRYLSVLLSFESVTFSFCTVVEVMSIGRFDFLSIVDV